LVATLLVAALALLLVGCAVAASPNLATPGGSPAPGSTTAASGPAASPSAAAATGLPSPILPTQTDTAWGRIWDELPAGFPRYPGATTTTVARDPVSAEFTVTADAAAVLTALRTALEAAGYSTVSVSGPLEDGSRALESAGSAAGCRVRTTVGPLGGQTYVSVLFGAACPFL
jgi:hypothetical protein